MGARENRGRDIDRPRVAAGRGRIDDRGRSTSRPAILHGRFTSVTGDIHYASTPQPQSIFEFSDHSGSVELLLPLDVSSYIELSSFEGEIDNGLTQVHPTASGVRNLQLTRGSGALDITARTFRGTVRLRAREP